MLKHFKYLFYVLQHKYYVLKCCFRERLFWRGLVHDMSKFRPSEWFSYASHFYGPWAETYTSDDKAVDPEFTYSSLLHQKRNDHHWQYWVVREDDGLTKVFPMSPAARLEMVCDWMAMSLAQGHDAVHGEGSASEYYRSHRDRMILNKNTRKWVEEFLGL
jgi:hypothetical protein